MTRQIEDPDFGVIELPKEYLDADALDERLDTIREAFDERLWPEGETFACPRCGERTFEGRSDLAYRSTEGRHVVSFRHLHGASCTNCGAKTLEPYEQIAVEDEADIGLHPDYEASVSRIGSGTLGTYWPKDVERVLNLSPDKRAFIEIIDRDAVLVRFEDEEEAPA